MPISELSPIVQPCNIDLVADRDAVADDEFDARVGVQTEPSWMLLRSPTTSQSLSPRSTQLNQTLACPSGGRCR